MDYQNGRIYKIVSDETDKIYIGSTTQPLSKRLSVHKALYKQYLAGNSNNVTSFDLIALGPVQIILVESFPCNNREELEKRECYYINEFKNIVVNRVHPTRTMKEYRQYNKEKIRQQDKQYHIDNKEQIHEYKNKPNLCGCGGNYTTANKSIHLKSIKHQNYLKEQQDKVIHISQYSYDNLFKYDSIFRLPKTYPNFIITEL